MYQTEVKIRVRYAETDQMGYCYYGNYAQYFEVARVEALRDLGVSYKKMELEGIMLPVTDFQIKYLKPAYYDDELTIKTTIEKTPGVRIEFKYETFNEENIKLNEASTILVFVSKDGMKPTRAPEELINQLENHMSAY